MIFVTVGTNEAPFDRLLAMVAELRTSEAIVIQHGSSIIRPANAELHRFLPFESIVEHVRTARAVVTHAGVGSVIVALANGKRPIVLARRKRFGEAVDDHQVFFGRRFSDAGLVTLVETFGDLREALARDQEPAELESTPASLSDELRRYLEESIRPAATVVSG
jgi:UDP-N-acetylglucosamine transferase subunit ALG13